MVITIALSMFAGIVPAENENLLINLDAAQNMAVAAIDVHKNTIENQRRPKDGES